MMALWDRVTELQHILAESSPYLSKTIKNQGGAGPANPGMSLLIMDDRLRFSELCVPHGPASNMNLDEFSRPTHVMAFPTRAQEGTGSGGK
jgi:hypothetical protein